MLSVICCGDGVGYKELVCEKVFPARVCVVCVCVHALLVAAVMMTESCVRLFHSLSYQLLRAMS